MPDFFRIPRLSLPICLDVELPTPAGSSEAHLATLARTRELIQHLRHDGYRSIIYTGAWWWNPATRTADVAWALEADLWAASYTALPYLPTGPWNTWTFWQRSSSGRVPGIAGNVDLDDFNGTTLDLRAYATEACGPLPQPAPPTCKTITVTGYKLEITVN